MKCSLKKPSSVRVGQDPKPLKSGVGTSYSPADISKISPKVNQFEPTPASPIRQNKHMAGVR